MRLLGILFLVAAARANPTEYDCAKNARCEFNTAGKVVMAEGDSNKDGRAEWRWMYTYDAHHKLLTEAWDDRADGNVDGWRFFSRDEYGYPLTMMLDADGDGIPEERHYYSYDGPGTRVMTEIHRDVNDDGTVDTREIQDRNRRTLGVESGPGEPRHGRLPETYDTVGNGLPDLGFVYLGTSLVERFQYHDVDGEKRRKTSWTYGKLGIERRVFDGAGREPDEVCLYDPPCPPNFSHEECASHCYNPAQSAGEQLK